MKRVSNRDAELPDYLEIGTDEVYEDPGSTLPQDLMQLPALPQSYASSAMSPASGLHPAQLEAAGATDFSRTLPPEIAPYATPNAALATGSAQSAAPPQEVILAGHGKHGRLAGDGPMPKRVLMVDDDITARHYMRSRLMLRGNVSIFEASSVAQGMALLQSQPHFDAALLDIDMGVQNGYELCKAIRAWVRSQGGKQPTIYIITSRTSLLDKMRAKMAGADEFLSKPPSPKQLAQLLLQL